MSKYPSDIRLLAECVYSAKFIAQGQAERLVGVVSEFVSKHQAYTMKHDALECTDEAIRIGNEILLKKTVELADMYPDYTCGILHIIFAG